MNDSDTRMAAGGRRTRGRTRTPFYANPSVVAWAVITVLGLLLVIAISGIS